MTFLDHEVWWRTGMIVIPIVLFLLIVCHVVRMRASTRHALWLLALLSLVALPFIPPIDVNRVRAVAQDARQVLLGTAEPDSDHQLASGEAMEERALDDGGGLVVAEEALDETETSRTPEDRSWDAAEYEHVPSVERWPFFLRRMPDGRTILEHVDGSVLASGFENASSGDGRTHPSAGAGAGGRGSRGSDSGRLDMLRADPGSQATSRSHAGGGRGEAQVIPPRGDESIHVETRERTARSESHSLEEDPAVTSPSGEIEDAAATIDEPTDEATTSPGSTDVEDRLRGFTTAWATWLQTLRETLMSVPALPLEIWILGVCVIAILSITRIVHLRAIVHNAVEAPDAVRKAAEASARALGLRRMPGVRMVDAPISPMIWCGRRAVLVLPVALWHELDDRGRQAVLCHELAHLRRRDHLVCWLELIVGCWFWWHPIVWLIRRRLREEADLACDAWVTLLMPQARRAYAQALLDTRRIVERSTGSTPVVGLGAGALRARKFSRRLTMVMTQPPFPRVSRNGLALVASLALGIALVAPIWACPPSSNKDAKKADVKTVDIQVAPEAPEPPESPPAQSGPAPAPAEEAEDMTTFEEFMRGRSQEERENMSLEERIRELEQRLDHLYQQLEEMEQSPQSPRSNLGQLQRELGAAVGSLRGLQGHSAMRGVVIVEDDDDDCTPSRGRVIQGVPTRDRDCTPSRSGSISRRYQVPGGRLQALSTLMRRSDVPTRVSTGSNSIVVHGSASEHIVFENFCNLIGGSDESREYRLSDGKLDALTNLMERSDVPILIERGCESITVHGNPVEQEVFSAFVNLLDGNLDQQAVGTVPSRPTVNVAVLGREAPNLVAQTHTLRAAVQALQAREKSYEAQSESYQARAESLRDHVESLRDQIRDIDDKTWRKSIEARIEHATKQVRQCDALARAYEVQSECCQREAESYEGLLEDLEEALEESSDELANLYEDIVSRIASAREEARDTQREAEELVRKARRMR